MKHGDAQVPPADAGRLETPVRRSWWREALGLCTHHYEPKFGMNVHRNVDNKIVGTRIMFVCRHCGATKIERGFGA